MLTTLNQTIGIFDIDSIKEDLKNKKTVVLHLNFDMVFQRADAELSNDMDALRFLRELEDNFWDNSGLEGKLVALEEATYNGTTYYKFCIDYIPRCVVKRDVTSISFDDGFPKPNQNQRCEVEYPLYVPEKLRNSRVWIRFPDKIVRLNERIIEEDEQLIVFNPFTSTGEEVSLTKYYVYHRTTSKGMDDDDDSDYTITRFHNNL
jgi:hypothetical protein